MIVRKVIYSSRGIINRIYPQIIRKMSSTEEEVIFETKSDKGVVTLNRPKALNALNLSMVEKIYPKLLEWEKNKSIVIMKGAGDKAFCAGGDVRSLVIAGLKGEKLGHVFFRKEYTLDGLIGSYKIPYIALIDGIVMGGGVGLSVHGKYRIATERTLFAMPETAIGLFPDVGGSYFLPRLQGKLGLYLATTGYRLKGSDVLKAGIATHFCESGKLKDLEAALLSVKDGNEIDPTLNKFCIEAEKLPEFSLNPLFDQINHCFGTSSIEETLERLRSDGSDWAKQTLKTLSEVSPTSVKVTYRELELGSKMSLQECLTMEYRLATACLANHDFYEGVRALLIDKDKSPKWKPPTYAEVTEEIVKNHFKALPEDQELRYKL